MIVKTAGSSIGAGPGRRRDFLPLAGW
jgi:hypothetical protein